ncbi:MAG TPA: universal stress protein [Solirubrobacteraceae bacterium]|jgi:nucleotide-binding universal stress UspA family protein|nr:universal stress protein [Solirubrobacteraceae bacterium]
MSVFHRILVAYDGSHDGDAALELAASLALDQNASLTLLTVVPDVATAVTSVEAGPYELESLFTEMLDAAKAKVPADVSVTTRLEHGPAAARITKAAEGHDLVVMGTHGRGRIGEALLGSVSRDVVHALRAAVLLARAPEASDDAGG